MSVSPQPERRRRKKLSAIDERSSVYEKLKGFILVQAWMRYHASVGYQSQLEARREHRRNAEHVLERFWLARHSEGVALGHVVKKVQALARGWISHQRVYLKLVREHQRQDMADGQYHPPQSSAALDRVLHRLEYGTSSPRADLVEKRWQKQHPNSDPERRRFDLLGSAQRRQAKLVGGGVRVGSASHCGGGAVVDAQGSVVQFTTNQGDGSRIGQSPLLGSGTGSASLFNRVQRKEALKRKLKQQGVLGSVKTQLSLTRSNVVDSPFMVGNVASAQPEPESFNAHRPPKVHQEQQHRGTLPPVHHSQQPSRMTSAGGEYTGTPPTVMNQSEINQNSTSRELSVEEDGDGGGISFHQDGVYGRSDAVGERAPRQMGPDGRSSIISNPFTTNDVMTRADKETKEKRKMKSMTPAQRVMLAQKAEVQRYVEMSGAPPPSASRRSFTTMRPPTTSTPSSTTDHHSYSGVSGVVSGSSPANSAISQTVLLNQMNYLLLETQRCSSAAVGGRGADKKKAGRSTKFIYHNTPHATTASGLSSYEVLRRAQVLAAMSKSSSDGQTTSRLTDHEDWEAGPLQEQAPAAAASAQQPSPSSRSGTGANSGRSRQRSQNNPYIFEDDVSSIATSATKEPIKQSRGGGQQRQSDPPPRNFNSSSDDPDLLGNNSIESAGIYFHKQKQVAINVEEDEQEANNEEEDDELLTLLLAGSTFRAAKHLSLIKKNGGRNPGPTKMALASGLPPKLISQSDGGVAVRPETFAKKQPKHPRGVTIGRRRGQTEPPPTAWPHAFIVVPVAHKLV